MNYIITKSCNKNCSYCFASHSREEDRTSVMTLENFKEYIEKYKDKNIKLLGGEPTAHPEFLEFLKVACEKGKKSIILISNFLFGEKILIGILDLLNYYNISFLANGTDLEVNNRMNIWKENYKQIYQKLYSLDREEHLATGITIDDSKDLSYYVKYFNFLKENTLKLERLRISLNCPGSEKDKNPYNVINNKKLGEKVLALVQLCLDNYITPSLDCVLYPCLFNNKEELKVLKKFMDKTSFICHGSPTDIFPDGSVEHCYPLIHKVSMPSNNDCFTEKELVNSLNIKYDILKSTVELPEECIKCVYHMNGKCEGPSLCFFNLKD